MTDKLYVTITANPQKIQAKYFPVKFRKMKISSLIYSPSTNTAGPINLKIDTSGQFDRTLEYGTNRKYLTIKTIVKDSSIGWVNISNCNDWDYCQNEAHYLTDFDIYIYEDSTMVSSVYLASNPMGLEFTFKE